MEKDMIQVSVEREVAAPIDQVWQLLEDFGNMDWFPGWTSIDVEGSGIGMTRRIHMPDMEPIEEVLVAMDSKRHYLSYTIPNIPLPVRDYRAEARLQALSPGYTLVIWKCEAVPQGIAPDEAKTLLEAVYDDMITKLERGAQR